MFAIGTFIGILVALCGAVLLTMLVFSPENDDWHFGRPRTTAVHFKGADNDPLS